MGDVLGLRVGYRESQRVVYSRGAMTTPPVSDFKLLTPEDYLAARRVGIMGPPNSFKTTSLLTWPHAAEEPLVIMSYPGEKGWESIPHDAPGVLPLIWETKDPEKVNPHTVVRQVESTTWEVLSGTGPYKGIKTFAGDGLHKLYCVTPEQRVLGQDLRWVPAGDLQAGDHLLGFSEKPGQGRLRRYLPSEVIGIEPRRAEVIRVVLSDGTELRSTLTHPWLAVKRDGCQVWVEAARLRAGDQLPRFFSPWTTLRTYDAGWLAGIFDGEGTIGRYQGVSGHVLNLSLAQKPGVVLDRACAVLQTLGIPFRVSHSPVCSNVHIERKSAMAHILGAVRPVRLLPRMTPQWLGALRADGRVSVEAVERAGEQEIVTMGTSTGTYITEGYGAHNTWYYKRRRTEIADWWLGPREMKGDPEAVAQNERQLDLTAYGSVTSGAHADFMLYVSKVLSSTVPYVVMTMWEESERDDPDNIKSKAMHLFPALPGKLATRIVGEFGTMVYAQVGLPNPRGERKGEWQLRPAGKVWGVGVKAPFNIAKGLPESIEQSFPALERALKGVKR